MVEETLLSIGEASQSLGVSEATLRQWTDEGKIKAFVTPGGHRRYQRAELKKFINASSRMLGIKDLVAEIAETTEQHREIARRASVTLEWNDRLDADARAQLGELGRSLLNIIIKYITEPSKREDNINQAHEIGINYGETLARLDLTLTDSVAAFISHRDPVMHATTQLLRKREAFTGRVVEAISLVTRVMDETLMGLVAAHQANTQSRKKKGESN